MRIDPPAQTEVLNKKRMREETLYAQSEKTGQFRGAVQCWRPVVAVPRDDTANGLAYRGPKEKRGLHFLWRE
jgi:hypothetical protein